MLLEHIENNFRLTFFVLENIVMLLMKHHATVAVIPPVKPLKSHHVEKSEQSQNYFSPLFINHLTTTPSLLCIISF